MPIRIIKCDFQFAKREFIRGHITGNNVLHLSLAVELPWKSTTSHFSFFEFRHALTPWRCVENLNGTATTWSLRLSGWRKAMIPPNPMVYSSFCLRNMNSENPDVTNYSQFLTKEMPYFLEVSVLDGSCLLVGHIHVFFSGNSVGLIHWNS